MENWEVILAQMFKNRGNGPSVGVELGTVISGMPGLSIGIGDDVILESDQLIIANGLYRMHRHQSDEHYTPVALTLKKGDTVILMPTPNKQIYCVLDKAGE